MNRTRFALPGRFSRLFPNLASAPNDNDLAKAIGKPFGPMHGSGQGANPRMSTGFTYLGQLIDHDLTFDPSPSLEPQDDADAQNFRSAAFDLDSIYGFGPNVSSHLYDERNPRKLAIGERGKDLARFRNTAVVGDPRNDENVIVSQLLTAFINFHNEVVDLTDGTFEEVRRLVQWHYQWIVLHQYLPKITGFSAEHILAATPKRFWYGNDQPTVPLEFSVAAFRFGHSQIRGRYDINTDLQGKGRSIFPELSGHRPLDTVDLVDWSFFFDMDKSNPPQPSLPIQPFLSHPLLDLPQGSVGPARDPVELSLAYRDIRRGQLRKLPSGHAVAKALEVPAEYVISEDVIWGKMKRGFELSGSRVPLGKPVPLWLYILFEAQELARGEHLGPVGVGIVSQVFVGLLKGDPESFLSKQPDWKPQFGASAGNFDITDLLRMAEDQKKRLA